MSSALPDNRSIWGELTANISACIDAEFFAVPEDIAHDQSLVSLQRTGNDLVRRCQAHNRLHVLTSKAGV